MKISKLSNIKDIETVIFNNEEYIDDWVCDTFTSVKGYLLNAIAYKLFGKKNVEQLSKSEYNAVISYFDSEIEKYVSSKQSEEKDIYDIEEDLDDYGIATCYYCYLLKYAFENNINSFDFVTEKLSDDIKDKSSVVEYFINVLIFNYVTSIYNESIQCDEEDKIFKNLRFLNNLDIKSYDNKVSLREYEKEVTNKLHQNKLDELYDNLINNVMSFDFDNEISLDTYINNEIVKLVHSEEFKKAKEKLQRDSLETLKDINNRFVLVDLGKYELVEKQ